MSDHPIEDYLDDLHLAARSLPAREARRLIAESEAHLYDTTAALMSNGVPELAAQQQALQRYGTSRELVHADRTRSPLSLVQLAARVTTSGVRLGAIGAILVGLSGVVAAVFRLVGGERALVDHPRGTSAAVLGDWTAETIYYRIALGVVGLLVLVALRGIGAVRGRRPAELDRPTTDTIALTLLVAGGAWTLGLGIDAAVLGGGSGQWFSAAIVALPAAGWYAWRVVPRLRTS